MMTVFSTIANTMTIATIPEQIADIFSFLLFSFSLSMIACLRFSIISSHFLILSLESRHPRIFSNCALASFTHNVLTTGSGIGETISLTASLYILSFATASSLSCMPFALIRHSSASSFESFQFGISAKFDIAEL